ncbi:hypothetical protein LSTR_LSTR009543 [Laodelphax striatellus]|uniref:Uncharacterized protein n=1 Tax=Laodelphax striatellus TaxID=195883 RepID=A0A482WS96_LAOST|nr:hypothetical protein LSTR_LSTR009543 [Laodelphax striatellus]
MSRPDRIIVDSFQIVPDTRRNQYTPNHARKNKVLQAIVQTHIALFKHFGMEDKIYDLTVCMQITNLLHTLHNVLRQRGNPTSGGTLTTKVGVECKIHDGAEVQVRNSEQCCLLVSAIFNAHGLPYTHNPGDRDHWYGIAGPILTSMAAFKNRLNEIRVGCQYFPVAKADGGVKYIK